ncbi:MAG TPA: type II toxin-antitoxin system VapC family toxin [Myxococcaceae bacterium]|nr:type II toxin-antitoxin system VapC family toxin [Myxococcaceae bacterium]
MDTHVWVWIASGQLNRMRPGLSEAIERAAREKRLFISASSIWEVALKVAKGGIVISGDLHTWVDEQRRAPGIQIWPLSPAVLIDMTRLPPWVRRSDGKEHRDPNDRFLVTTARRRSATLVTCDEMILDYARQGHLEVFDARP